MNERPEKVRQVASEIGGFIRQHVIGRHKDLTKAELLSALVVVVNETITSVLKPEAWHMALQRFAFGLTAMVRSSLPPGIIMPSDKPKDKTDEPTAKD